MAIIQSKIAQVNDFQARRISATENLLRQDLTAIKSIEATIEIIDMEMGKDPLYLTVGKTPLKRLHKKRGGKLKALNLHIFQYFDISDILVPRQDIYHQRVCFITQYLVADHWTHND